MYQFHVSNYAYYKQLYKDSVVRFPTGPKWSNLSTQCSAGHCPPFCQNRQAKEAQYSSEQYSSCWPFEICISVRAWKTLLFFSVAAFFKEGQESLSLSVSIREEGLFQTKSSESFEVVGHANFFNRKRPILKQLCVSMCYLFIYLFILCAVLGLQTGFHFFEIPLPLISIYFIWLFFSSWLTVVSVRGWNFKSHLMHPNVSRTAAFIWSGTLLVSSSEPSLHCQPLV